MYTKEFLLLVISAVAVVCTFRLARPIRQDLRYHHFADIRTMLGVPNFMNVISNLFFILAALLGLYAMLTGRDSWNSPTNLSYLTFFTGVFLTGIGSSWYHLKPHNETLVWDRLPMTIAFAGLFCSVVSEAISPAAGAILLPLLIALGVFSVLYWIRGERRDRGDLRLYGIIQFLPMLLIPLIMFMYGGERDYIMRLAGLMLFYCLAKIFELLDGFIYSHGKVISGHTMKHIAAAAGVVCMAKIFI